MSLNPTDRRRALRALVETWRSRGHEFGVNDCALFAATWVQMVAGQDPAADVRGIYSTEDEADDLIEQLGGFEVLVPARLELVGIAPVWFAGGMNARMGDILLGSLPTGHTDGRPDRERDCLAVCNGQVALSPSDGGFAEYRLDRFRGGWRV